jgi:hypothetical protein
VAVFALPLALLVVAVVLGLAYGGGPSRGGGTPDDRPLALSPVEAPDAATPACDRLLGRLRGDLPADPAPLPALRIAAPAPPGSVAWAGPADRPDDPVVLRCGLPRPPELTPTSALIVINGVGWLDLAEPDRDTFVAVDREVYLAVTVPRGLGTGPIQTVSDVVGTALRPRPSR